MEVVHIPVQLFQRMCEALISIEKYLSDMEENKNVWVSEEKAMELLGCSKRKLYYLKGKEISYKAVGKRHQYNRKSIESYNKKISV